MEGGTARREGPDDMDAREISCPPSNMAAPLLAISTSNLTRVLCVYFKHIVTPNEKSLIRHFTKWCFRLHLGGDELYYFHCI